MKILIIATCYSPTINGVTTNIGMIEKALLANGHEVKILCPKHKERVPSENVIEIPSIRNPLDHDYPLPITLTIPKKIREEDFDLIHLHQPFAVRKIAERIAKRKNIPLIFTNHTQYVGYTDYYSIPGKLIGLFVKSSLKRFYKKADLVISATKEIENSVKEIAPEVKIKTIPVPINDLVLSKNTKVADIRKKHGINKEDFLFLYLGRLAREKNIKPLIAAFNDATKQKKNVKLLIVGPGDYRKSIVNHNSSIIFAGPVSQKELHDYYSQSDFFVSASTSETFGLVFAEAAYCGLPLLGIDSPGVRNIIQDGSNGRLAKSYRDLISLIKEIPENKNELITYKKNARNSVKMFTSEENMKELLKTYEVIIGDSKNIPKDNSIINVDCSEPALPNETTLV